jgi:hypothetical protein
MLVPELLDECGVAALCAARLVVSRGEPTGFAAVLPSPRSPALALAGTRPVDASSGTHDVRASSTSDAATGGASRQAERMTVLPPACCPNCGLIFQSRLIGIRTVVEDLTLEETANPAYGDSGRVARR